jgi:hypothetical protein
MTTQRQWWCSTTLGTTKVLYSKFLPHPDARRFGSKEYRLWPNRFASLCRTTLLSRRSHMLSFGVRRTSPPMAPRLNIPLRLGFWSYVVLRRHSRPQQLARTWVIDFERPSIGAVSSIHRYCDGPRPTSPRGRSSTADEAGSNYPESFAARRARATGLCLTPKPTRVSALHFGNVLGDALRPQRGLARRLPGVA